MKIKIRPYRKGSKSVKALAAALKCKSLRFEGSKLKFNPMRHTVINWGNSTPMAGAADEHLINPPSLVATASNKLLAFERMKEWGGVRIPPFTTEREEAQDWINGGDVVVVRNKLTGNSGDGIVVVEEGEVPAAPLYTEYVKKKDEYRIHVAFGEVIGKQRKAAVEDREEEPDWKVRNLAGGFIFARNEGIEPPDDVIEQALLAMEALGLHFGAVDIGYNGHYKQATVYEVNCAPGLTGTTLDEYVAAFRKEFGEV